MDTKFEYVKRSFCILELYGAIQGGGNLLCLHSFSTDGIRRILADDGAKVSEYWVGPINLAAAQTRCKEDKQMIDVFVQNQPGSFENVNQLITDKLTTDA